MQMDTDQVIMIGAGAFFGVVATSMILIMGHLNEIEYAVKENGLVEQRIEKAITRTIEQRTTRTNEIHTLNQGSVDK